MLKFFKSLSPNFLVRRTSKALSCCFRAQIRYFADPSHTTTNKQYVIHGKENDQRVRVRRARSSDVPRVLRFMREHSRTTWPSLMKAPLTPSSSSQVVLADYVSRALAQGHSMLAEQIATKRGWLTMRGLALASAVCPWDAHVLEKWAQCIRDTRSRRLFNFTAHCLRAPGLHDKYRVHNILQVTLLLSPESQNNPEIVQVLVKSAIQRGRDVGIPLLRFDVTNDIVAKALEDLKLSKEWYLAYDVLPETMQESSGTSSQPVPPTDERKGHFIAVYTVLTSKELEDKKGDTLDTSKSIHATSPTENSKLTPSTPTKTSNPSSTSATDTPTIHFSPSANKKPKPKKNIPTPGCGSTPILSTFQKTPAWSMTQSTKPNHTTNSSPRPTTLDCHANSNPSLSDNTNLTPKLTQDVNSNLLSKDINSSISSSKTTSPTDDISFNPAQTHDGLSLTLSEDKNSNPTPAQGMNSNPVPIQDNNVKLGSNKDTLTRNHNMSTNSSWMQDNTSSSPPNQINLTQTNENSANANPSFTQNKNLKSTPVQNISFTSNMNASPLLDQGKNSSSCLTQDIIAPTDNINESPMWAQANPEIVQNVTLPAPGIKASPTNAQDINPDSTPIQNKTKTASDINLSPISAQDIKASPILAQGENPSTTLTQNVTAPVFDGNTSPISAQDLNSESTPQNVTQAAQNNNTSPLWAPHANQSPAQNQNVTAPVSDLNISPIGDQNIDPGSTRTQNVTITPEDVNISPKCSPDTNLSPTASQNVTMPFFDINAQDTNSGSIQTQNFMPTTVENSNENPTWDQYKKSGPTPNEDINASPVWTQDKNTTETQDTTTPVIHFNASPMWAQDTSKLALHINASQVEDKNVMPAEDKTTLAKDIDVGKIWDQDIKLNPMTTQDMNVNPMSQKNYTTLTQNTTTSGIDINGSPLWSDDKILTSNSSPPPSPDMNVSTTYTMDNNSSSTSTEDKHSNSTQAQETFINPTRIFDVNSSPMPVHFMNSPLKPNDDTSSNQISAQDANIKLTPTNNPTLGPIPTTQYPIPTTQYPFMNSNSFRFVPFPPVTPIPTPVFQSPYFPSNLPKHPSIHPTTPFLSPTPTTDPNMTPPSPQTPNPKPNPSVPLNTTPTSNT